jgi:hypothetical protein
MNTHVQGMGRRCLFEGRRGGASGDATMILYGAGCCAWYAAGR